MITRLIIIALLWLGSVISYNPDYAAISARTLHYLHLHQGQIAGYAILVAMGLVLGAFILGQIRSFSLLHLLARGFFEVSQFAICLLSFAAVVFWFDFNLNLWAALGSLLVAVPFLMLAASCLSFWIFDFNYPLYNRILRNLTLPALSLVIILIAGIVG